jgi:hypothetical protein
LKEIVYRCSAQKRDASGLILIAIEPGIADVSNHECETLNNAGVRAVRFNVKRGSSEEIHHLESRTRQCDIFIKTL